MKKKDVFYGRQPALEILRSDSNVEKILLQKGLTGDEFHEIRKLCSEKDIPVQYVPKEKLNYMLFPATQEKQTNHQGVAGIFGLIKYYKLDDIYNQVLTQGKQALFLLLDGITDIRNIGAISRTALCMGVDAIVIPFKGSAQINAEAIKSSAGALLDLPICREESLQTAINYLKLNGIAVLGSSLKAETKIYDTDFNKPLSIVIGSEGYGISKEVVELCTEEFVIPMTGKLDSLNASVSAGMILYEAAKQRSKIVQ